MRSPAAICARSVVSGSICVFGIGQRRDTRRPPRAAVLHVWTENAFEERRRQLVMLGVGGVRGDRNRLRSRSHFRSAARCLPRPSLPPAILLAQPGRDDATDAEPNNGIGHEIAIEQRFDHDNLRGGHGTKALVVCW